MTQRCKGILFYLGSNFNLRKKSTTRDNLPNGNYGELEHRTEQWRGREECGC